MKPEMMKYFLKTGGLAILMLLLSLCGIAQDAAPQMADTMRSNGKIYVVVSVCLVILIGLFIYVARVDWKLSRLEKEMRAGQ